MKTFLNGLNGGCGVIVAITICSIITLAVPFILLVIAAAIGGGTPTPTP